MSTSDEAAEVGRAGAVSGAAPDPAPKATAGLIRLVAHDLRSPLTTIQLNAQLIERAAEREGREREHRWAMHITSATRRLDDLIEQLVEAERLCSGQLQLALGPVAWDELLREIVAAADADASRAPRVRLVVPEGGSRVVADRERLGRALRGLLRLALQGQDRDASVDVELVERDGRARCTIGGSRPMDASHAPRPASPPGSATSEPGQSIVLHFARVLIERLGGELRVTAAPSFLHFEVVLQSTESAAADGVSPR